jgi:DNA uptake protein ComE-like DNA-binding protein
MTRLVALTVAGLFAAGTLGAPALAAEPKTSDPAKPQAPQATKPAPTDKKAGDGAGVAQVVNINSASIDELKALPGVGEEYAKKIADNCPYARKSDLVRRKIVPKSTYNSIKERITTGHTTAKNK